MFPCHVCPGSAGTGERAFSVSVDAALADGDFQGMGVFRSDEVGRRREWRVPRCPVIVSMSPPGYPSAWFDPSRARCRFPWQCHGNSIDSAVCCRRGCRRRRAASGLRSRAAWIWAWRPASISRGLTYPIAPCSRTALWWPAWRSIRRHASCCVSGVPGRIHSLFNDLSQRSNLSLDCG